jgi:hypothetical protein
MMNTDVRKIAAITVAVSFIAGCATSSDKITAQYVSPMQYNSLSCQQVESEMIRVSNQVRTVAGVQDDKASEDAAAVAGSLIFWPALFFLVGGDKEQELAQLKGEHQALQQSAIQKECGFSDQFGDDDSDGSEEA